MVVVVVDPILEASRRPGGLNTSDETAGDKHAEGVVHRLKRDGTNLPPDRLGYAVGRDVGLPRDCPQNRQALRSHLNPALTEEVGLIGDHPHTVTQTID